MLDNFKGRQGASLRLYLYIFILVILLPLFFIDLPFGNSSRSVKAFWDLGHILFFMLFVRILAGRQTTNGFSWTWVGKVLVLVLAIGILIEIVQSGLVGRLSSWIDVLRNLGGGIIGLAWVCWEIVTRKQRRKLLLVMVSVAIISTIPLGLALMDESRARRDFPLLSTFETKGELSRWQAKTEISRVENPVRQGRFALRLPLTTDMYSGISLEYFPEDWQGMKGLSLSIYNPEQSEIQMTFRVHDRLHVEGEQIYADRFNRLLTMQPGWNDIFIAMDEIKNAPQGRKMDLENIYGFGLFVSRLKVGKVIYIDDVRLVSY